MVRSATRLFSSYAAQAGNGVEARYAGSFQRRSRYQMDDARGGFDIFSDFQFVDGIKAQCSKAACDRIEQPQLRRSSAIVRTRPLFGAYSLSSRRNKPAAIAGTAPENVGRLMNDWMQRKGCLCYVDPNSWTK